MANKRKKDADEKVARKLDERQDTENRDKPGRRNMNSGEMKQERDEQGGGGGGAGGGGGKKNKGKPTNA